MYTLNYKNFTPWWLMVLVALLMMSVKVAFAQRGADEPRVDKEGVIEAEIVGHVFKPATREPTEARVNSLQTAENIEISLFCDGMEKPRMMVVREDGTIYLTGRPDKVVMMKDLDQDGRADVHKVVLEKKGAHGLALNNGKLYLVTVNEVYEMDLMEDGTPGEPRKIIEDLPDGGQHANRTMAFGPDGQLYISVGSTCNACEETRAENATIVVAEPGTWERKIFARGLRNTIGFDWHPQTGELWGMDHGIDWLGDTEQKEELNRIEQNQHYGWPYVYGEGKRNPADEPPKGISYAEFEDSTRMPIMSLPAHCAPLDMVFINSDHFPESWQGDAIVTLHGSWNRKQPSGYKIVRIHFDDEGRPDRYTDLVSGFLVENNTAQFGRVVGLATLADGSLLVSDDSGGMVYRISYNDGMGR